MLIQPIIDQSPLLAYAINFWRHIIYSSISIHLQLVKYKIICKEQHGFRKQYSCETQLLEAVNDIAYNLDKGNQTVMILLQKIIMNMHTCKICNWEQGFSLLPCSLRI